MKNLPLILLSSLLLISCGKSSEEKAAKKKADTLRVIDSINQARTKYNDSIRILNNKNRFGDLSGKHTISFKSDDADFKGNVNFNKIGQDLYDVSGNAKSGNNSLIINGEIKRVSDIHLNFDGKIVQNINGVPFTRSEKTTFRDEKKGAFWRLQNKVNGDGFVEYIDIYK